MKKNRDSDALAARLAAAGNQPPVFLAFPRAAPPEPEAAPPVETAAVEPEAKPEPAAAEPRAKKPRRTRASRATPTQPEEEDTVAMSLRPSREVHTRYVLAAAERTRETRRVVSAQQIMLEVLERGP